MDGGSMSTGGGPLGMAGGGMGMGGAFGGCGGMAFPSRGMGNGMGMGMPPGMDMYGAGGMPPSYWDMLALEEEEEDEEDEAFWDDEEMSDVFTSYLKGQRGKRKGHGFGGMLFHLSLLQTCMLALLKDCKWVFNSTAVLALAFTSVAGIGVGERLGVGELC